ncbi:MAG: 6-phosphogluconolactonase [Granulosicoccaceae bacterium]|jgi:6-phosphogluconolactonase
MSHEGISPQWLRYDTADAVAAATVACILDCAQRAIAERGVFRLVLAGGTTPKQAYQQLRGADTDWSRWEVFFGDERCLPADDPERNSVMASEALLDHVPVPADNIFPITAEHGAESAAQAYRSVIDLHLPFDLVLLGMGEDGHTASLFPGHVHDQNETVHAVHNAPKPPSDRVSLGASALGNTHELLILVTGSGKQDAVKRWQAGEALPVTEINPALAKVLIDDDAWPE